MTNQTCQQQEDLLNMGDFYNQLSLNSSSTSSGNKSRLNSKSSSNDLNNDYLFNSISSPSKSSTNEVSSPESMKTQATSQQTRQRLNAPNFASFKSESSSSSDDSQITKLFVGNLPTSTTLPELLAVFKKYGPVNEKLSVVKDQNYAFIHFYNRKDAQLALQEVNDSLFKDRYIRVQFSTSQGYTFNSKNKYSEKKRFHNSDSKTASQQTLASSVSNSSLFPQQQQQQQQISNFNQLQSSQSRNFRPIVNKSYQNPPPTNTNHQMSQVLNQKFQEYQQTQLMHLLYLAQLQQQQQQQQQQQAQQLKFARSNTIDNFTFHAGTDFSLPSVSSSSGNFPFSSTLNSQANQDTASLSTNMVRSNTMFSFPNSLNFNR